MERSTTPEIEAAITRAANFVAHHGSEDQDTLLLASILFHRFHIDDFRGAPRLAATNASQSTQSLRFLRIVVPAYLAPEEVLSEASQPVDFATSNGLYCDKRRLPANFAGTLRSEVAAGGFRTTHAGLALIFMRDLGCFERYPEIGALRSSTERSIRAIAQTKQHEGFVLEAAAVSCVMAGCPDLGRFRDSVVAAQNEDGGWPIHASGGSSHPHPTVRALWYLLESSRTPDSTTTVPLQ